MLRQVGLTKLCTTSPENSRAGVMRIWLPVLCTFALISVGGGVGNHRRGHGRITRWRRVREAGTPDAEPEFRMTDDEDKHQYTGWSSELQGRAHGSRAQAVSSVAAPTGSMLENVQSVHAEIQRDILVCLLVEMRCDLYCRQAAVLLSQLRNAVAVLRSVCRLLLSIMCRSRAPQAALAVGRSVGAFIFRNYHILRRLLQGSPFGRKRPRLLQFLQLL